MMDATNLTAGQIGVRFIAAVFVAVFFVVAALDLWWEYRDQPGVARRLQEWTRQHRFLAAGMTCVLGAMLGHFFLWERF